MRRGREDRSTVARHATLPSPSRLSVGLKLVGAALAVVLVSAIAVGAFFVIDIASRVGDAAVTLEDGGEVAPPSLSA